MVVVTTFTVLADIARNVAGDAATVASITKPGAGDPQLPADAGRPDHARRRPTSFCGTA